MVSIVRKQSNGCMLLLSSLSPLYCPGSRRGTAPPQLLGLPFSVYKIRRFLDPFPSDSRFPRVDSYHKPLKDCWDLKLDCFIVFVLFEAPEIPKSGSTLEVIKLMYKGEEGISLPQIHLRGEPQNMTGDA